MSTVVTPENKAQEGVSVNNPNAVQTPTDQKDIVAIVALVIAVITLCAWFIPLCGVPMSLLGIGLGIFALSAPTKKNLAIAAIVLGALGLIASILNSIAGVLIANGTWQI